jgi:hypothetical protein
VVAGELLREHAGLPEQVRPRDAERLEEARERRAYPAIAAGSIRVAGAP